MFRDLSELCLRSEGQLQLNVCEGRLQDRLLRFTIPQDLFCVIFSTNYLKNLCICIIFDTQSKALRQTDLH